MVPISNFREYNTDFSREKAFANDRTITTSRDYLSLIWEKIVTYWWVKQKSFTVSLAKLHFYLAKNTLQLYCYQRIPSFSIFNVLVFWVPKSRYFAGQNKDHMKPDFDLFQSFLISKRRWKNGVIYFLGSLPELWSKMGHFVKMIMMVTKIQVTRCKSV